MTGQRILAFFLVLLPASSLFATANEPAQPPLEGQPPDDLRAWEWYYLRARLGKDDGPKLPDTATFDKVVVDTLRDVHNRGAELFNEGKDYAGAYRMYQGALVTIRPLLAHRSDAQKIIDEGLAAAEKENSPATKAFKLHEAIEAVRTNLKEAAIKKIPEPAPSPRDKTTPKTPDKGTTDNAGKLAGWVTIQGKPLTAAEITVVSLDQAKPRVFTAPILADGSYAFKEPLPPGRYVVIVTAKAVPEKYATTTSSGIVIVVKAGTSMHDIELK
jgi:hypothetical protein